MSRVYSWLDTGTHDSLLQSNQFVQTIEKRQGMKIACLEEIAFREKWISLSELKDSANQISSSSYGKYLKQIVEENS